MQCGIIPDIIPEERRPLDDPWDDVDWEDNEEGYNYMITTL